MADLLLVFLAILTYGAWLLLAADNGPHAAVQAVEALILIASLLRRASWPDWPPEWIDAEE